MVYFVYIIQSSVDETYYIGSTRNIEERLQRHNQGRSQYTKPKRPWTLIYSEAQKRIQTNLLQLKEKIKLRGAKARNSLRL